MAADGRVDVGREGRVALVTIDRPPVNALSVAMLDRLGQAIRALDGEKDVRAVVLTGAGDRAFCAGGDIDEFAAMDNEALLTAIRAGQRLVWDLEHLEKPTIAAVNGACLGAGNGIAMACDLPIAGASAGFRPPGGSPGPKPPVARPRRLAPPLRLAQG